MTFCHTWTIGKVVLQLVLEAEKMLLSSETLHGLRMTGKKVL